MSDEPFSYEDFKSLTPDWHLYNFKDFPAVKWKLKNLERFKRVMKMAITQPLSD